MNHSSFNTHGEDSMAEPTLYTIRIREPLAGPQARRFEGFTIMQDSDGHSILTGPVVDQAALHGVIRTIQMMGMTLLSIQEIPKEDS